MSQTEVSMAKAPSSAWSAKPVHIEDISDKIDSLPGKIGSGRAFLKVVAYPWGVEFDVFDTENEK
jgi:hypothetical protein